MRTTITCSPTSRQQRRKASLTRSTLLNPATPCTSDGPRLRLNLHNRPYVPPGTQPSAFVSDRPFDKEVPHGVGFGGTSVRSRSVLADITNLPSGSTVTANGASAVGARQHTRTSGRLVHKKTAAFQHSVRRRNAISLSPTDAARLAATLARSKPPPPSPNQSTGSSEHNCHTCQTCTSEEGSTGSVPGAGADSGRGRGTTLFAMPLESNLFLVTRGDGGELGCRFPSVRV